MIYDEKHRETNTTEERKEMMKAIVINKKTGASYEARAERKNGEWLIGGDKADFKNFHHIIHSKGVEYELRNGRLVAV